ncbi:GNAT family N-acetyltransferase [Flavobacterium sp.]|uniref:GNAT family N-acetyltransferase n=1 Tax=Flavobacterium sp. TaxID=239 RepID=UPI002604B821|nr:GNAT family N-acetyltransferase [Flavobacterium sp.]MDD3003996.1 GNAT family N-acetyltransferase [Flavobacterium sp.]
MADIEVKYYSKEHEAAHRVFAQKYWSKKRRLIPDYIYWKFRGNPTSELKSFILAFDGEEVVGQFGLVPCKILIDDELIEAQWACDLMVDTQYRGKGVAEKLYNFAHKNKPITLGSDPSPAAEKSMIKKGYITLDGPRKFLFPIKVGEIFKLKRITIPFLNKIPNPFLPFLYFFKNNKFKLIEPKEYGLLANATDSNELKCYYDTDFYNWRFSKFHPYYQGIDCYKNEDGTIFTGYFVNDIYLLTDFKVNGLRSFMSIIAFIYFKYRKMNLLRIKFVSKEVFLNNKLPFLGFIRFSTRTKVILFTYIDEIKEYVINKKFSYTLHDSDENI